jgi:hypothetical protein
VTPATEEVLKLVRDADDWLLHHPDLPKGYRTPQGLKKACTDNLKREPVLAWTFTDENGDTHAWTGKRTTERKKPLPGDWRDTWRLVEAEHKAIVAQRFARFAQAEQGGDL